MTKPLKEIIHLCKSTGIFIYLLFIFIFITGLNLHYHHMYFISHVSKENKSYRKTLQYSGTEITNKLFCRLWNIAECFLRDSFSIWPHIKKSEYSTSTEDSIVLFLSFHHGKMTLSNLLLLSLLGISHVIIILSSYNLLVEISSRGIRFKYPGTVIGTRWMTKAFYSIKIYLFHKTKQAMEVSAYLLYIFRILCVS